MSFYRGPKVVTEGLVFGYDTGYPVVSGSSDTYRFNLGEPTTNVLNDTIQVAGTGTSLGSDSFGEFIQLGDNTSGYSRFQLPNISLSSNETYTWSFELYATETFDRGSNNYSFDQNEYSDQYTGNDASRVSFSQSQPNSIPAGQWTPFRLTVTMKDNLTNARAGDYFRFYYPAFQNKKVYYRNMQFERDKDHKTPYAGQGGSRSSTGALIDLTGNRTVDLSDVSFNSDAQMTFNGTDNFIELDTTLSGLIGSSPSAVSFEFVAKADNLTNPIGISGDYTSPPSTGFGIKRSSSNNKLEFRVYATGGIPSSTTDIPTDSYFHGVCVWDGTGTGEHRIYFNGVLETTDTSAGTTWNHSNGNLRIGDIYGGMGVPGEWQGGIPLFKVYSKALTDEEVANNFNAIKNRFNL